MRLPGLFHRVGRGDPQGDASSLSMFPKLVEEVGAMVIGADHGAVKRDPALAGASPAAHGDERTAVAYCSHREFILDCAVGESVHAVGSNRADLPGDVVPAAHDDVGAEVTNQLFV